MEEKFVSFKEKIYTYSKSTLLRIINTEKKELIKIIRNLINIANNILNISTLQIKSMY